MNFEANGVTPTSKGVSISSSGLISFTGAIALAIGALLHHGGSDAFTLYIALLGAAACAASLSRQTLTAPAAITPLAIGMLALPLYLVVASFWSVLPSLSLETAGPVGMVAIGYWLVRHSLSREISWHSIIWIVRAAGLVAAGAAVAEYAVTQQRTMGLFLDFNAQGGFFGALTLIATGELIAKVRNGEDARQLAWPVAGIALTVFALATTGSLSTLLAFSAGLSLLLLIAGPQRKGTIKVITLVAAWLALSVGFFNLTASEGSDALKKLQGLESHTSFTDRIKMATSCVRMYADHMPLGSGLGTYKTLYRKYRDPGEISTTGDLAHNDYAQFLAEGGPILLAFPLLLLAWLVGRGWRVLREADDQRMGGPAAAGLIAALLALLFHASMNFILYIAPVTLLMGACLARLDWKPAADGATTITFKRPLVITLLAGAAVFLTMTLGLRALFFSSQARECEYNVCKVLHQEPGRVMALANFLAITQPTWVPGRLYLIDQYHEKARLQTDPQAREHWYRATLSENLSLLRKLPAIDVGYSSLANLLKEAPELAGAIPPSLPHDSLALYRLALDRDPLDMSTRISLAAEMSKKGDDAGAFQLLYTDGMALWRIPALSRDDRLNLAIASLQTGLRSGRCQESLVLADIIAKLDPPNPAAATIKSASSVIGAAQTPGCGVQLNIEN